MGCPPVVMLSDPLMRLGMSAGKLVDKLGH